MLNNKQIFQLNPEQLTIRNILNNKNFVEIEIWAISDDNPNRNSSYFTIEGMKKGIKTFVDKPILGFFNREGDFEQHNGKVNYDPELDQAYWDNTGGEQILGFIREKDQREIVEKDGKTWIRCTAMIYTQYNFKQVKRLLKDKNKKVSVEVEVTESEVIDGVQHIYDFVLLGITILGSKGGIPIREGIEDAHLSVLDLMESNPLYQQKQALVFAYAELNKEEDRKLAQEDNKALKVNKSKEAMSNSVWSEVDKTVFAAKIVEASNLETIAKEIYLDLGEGWETDASKMKYPVMQFSGEELVYNREGLASAKSYAEKNNKTDVLSKLKDIYTDLGLDFENEQKYDCSVFCDLYEDEPEKDPETDEDDDKDDDDDEGKEGKDPVNTQHSAAEPNKQCDFEAQCEELTMKCQDYESRCQEYEARCNEYEKKCCSYEERCNAYEEKISKSEKAYEALNKELEAAKEELKSFKEQEEAKKVEDQKKYVDTLAAKMGLLAEDIEEVRTKCEAHQFACNEDIDKEMAYLSWKKNFSVKTNIKKTEGYSVNIVGDTTNVKSRETLAVGERLKRNINK